MYNNIAFWFSKYDEFFISLRIISRENIFNICVEFFRIEELFFSKYLCVLEWKFWRFLTNFWRYLEYIKSLSKYFFSSSFLTTKLLMETAMKTDLTQSKFRSSRSNYSYRLTFSQSARTPIASFTWFIYPSRIYRGKNKVHIQFYTCGGVSKILSNSTAANRTKRPSSEITVSDGKRLMT